MAEPMTMRRALELMVDTFHADDGGTIEHALVTTFNFDPGFFERNVLPLICGLKLDDIKSMSLDAAVREMYHPLRRTKVVVAYDQGVLQGVSGGGVRYSILPRHLKDGFFHAKIVVLAGKDAGGKPLATVMVGSGNMTLSGWADNIEVATWVRVNRRDAQELLDFYDYLSAPDELGPGIAILGNITEESLGHELFIQHPSQEKPLFDRMIATVPSTEMQVYSPYWSERAVRKFAPGGRVICYPAKGKSGYQFPVENHLLEDEKASIQVMAVKAEERFRHAKAYVWGRYVAVGSANCTDQALHTKKNVEAMLRFEGLKFSVPPSEPLKEWSTALDEEEGIKPAPLEVLVIADYEKRVYQLDIAVSSESRCRSWSLRIGEVVRNRQGMHAEILPFEVNRPVAKVFRVEWQGDDESGYLTGMVIPRGGNDVELGYRPKRSLERIFDDMLRHRQADIRSQTGGRRLSGMVDDTDVEADDVDGEDLSKKGEIFEFDMYGMYQSFFHLRKDIGTLAEGKESENKLTEVVDTLLEILQAVKDGEVSNDLQRWLMVQECMDLVRQLPEQEKFGSFYCLEAELNRKLLEVLQRDDELKRYKISPEALLGWVRQELGYAG